MVNAMQQTQTALQPTPRAVAQPTVAAPQEPVISQALDTSMATLNITAESLDLYKDLLQALALEQRQHNAPPVYLVFDPTMNGAIILPHALEYMGESITMIRYGFNPQGKKADLVGDLTAFVAAIGQHIATWESYGNMEEWKKDFGPKGRGKLLSVNTDAVRKIVCDKLGFSVNKKTRQLYAKGANAKQVLGTVAEHLNALSPQEARSFAALSSYHALQQHKAEQEKAAKRAKRLEERGEQVTLFAKQTEKNLVRLAEKIPIDEYKHYAGFFIGNLDADSRVEFVISVFKAISAQERDEVKSRLTQQA